MGHENFENPKSPIEQDPVENNGEEVDVVKGDELGVEEIITYEMPEEASEIDPETLGLPGEIPEAPLDENEA